MRCIVTGVDDRGLSCVTSEATFPDESGERSHLLYTSDDTPPPRPPGAGALGDRFMIPAGGSRWVLVRFAPGQEAEMHHTDTVDFDTIIEGSIDLILDDGSHPLVPGDCVVVTGVDHAWRAGPEGCVFSVVGLGTPPLG